MEKIKVKIKYKLQAQLLHLLSFTRSAMNILGYKAYEIRGYDVSKVFIRRFHSFQMD